MKANVDLNFTFCDLTVFHVAWSFVYVSMKSFNSVGWLSAVAYIAAGGCSLFLVKLLET